MVSSARLAFKDEAGRADCDQLHASFITPCSGLPKKRNWLLAKIPFKQENADKPFGLDKEASWVSYHRLSGAVSRFA